MATASDGSQPPAPTADDTAQTEAPPSDTQRALIAKQETETPKLVDKVILGADSYVEKFADGKIFVTTAGIRADLRTLIPSVFETKPQACSILHGPYSFGLPTR